MSVNGHNVTRETASEETCPTCNRWLATIYDDGTLDLAPTVSLGVHAMLPADFDGASGAIKIEPSVGSALCMRWRCKLRRRLTRGFA